VGLTTIGWKS